MSDQGDKPGSAESKPEGAAEDAVFDAIAAAAELSEAMGAPVEPGAPIEGPRFEDMLEEEVEALQKELAEKDRVIAQKDALIAKSEEHAGEAHSDVERAKERLGKDADRRVAEKTRKVLLSFLDVMDDLDRALGATRDAAATESVLEGVELVKRRFLTVLEGHGVAPMPSMGERFDPNHHEAVTMMSVTDAAQEGCVVAVVREGYIITADGAVQVLRPANVAVGRA